MWCSRSVAIFEGPAEHYLGVVLHPVYYWSVNCCAQRDVSSVDGSLAELPPQPALARLTLGLVNDACLVDPGPA